MTATILFLALLSAAGLAFAAWLLRLPVACLALAVVPLMPAPAMAQVGKVSPCNNGSCNKRVDAAAFPPSGKFDCTTQTNCIGATCPPQCPPGPKGDTGATGATGPQGPQGIPGVCPTCSGTGGSGAWVDSAAQQTSPKPTETRAPGFYGGHRRPIAVFSQGDAAGSAVSGYISATGQTINGLQAMPLDRDLHLAQGRVYNGGGFPWSNGYSYLCTQGGRSALDWPLEFPIVRRQDWTFRNGQKIFAGYGGGLTYGAQWRVRVSSRAPAGATTCDTSTDPSPVWCTATGCIIQDGECDLVREVLVLGPITDGGAVYAPSWGADAYEGVGNQFGQDSANSPSKRTVGGDNDDWKEVTLYPNVDGPDGDVASMAVSGSGWHSGTAGGDPRDRTSENEEHALWNPYLHRWSVGQTLSIPKLRPVLTLVSNAGGVLDDREYCFTSAIEDEELALPTAASLRYQCIRPKPGDCIDIAPRVDAKNPWPAPHGQKNRARFWMYEGMRLQDPSWCMFAGTVEKEKSAAGVVGNDHIRVCRNDDLAEKQTCNGVNRNARMIAEVHDPRSQTQTWRAGMLVGANYTVRPANPANDDGWVWFAEGFSCTPDCSDCKRTYGLTGTTGATEPNFSPSTYDLVFDNGICWRRQAPEGFTLATLGVHRTFVEDPVAGRMKIAAQSDPSGYTVFDATKPNPLLAPVVRLDATGLCFFNADGKTCAKKYTAAGVQ